MLRTVTDIISGLRLTVNARNSRYWNEVDRHDRVDWSNDWDLSKGLSAEANALFAEGNDLYPIDKQQALAKFEASAALENPIAMVFAGRMYASATGTILDRDRALEFYHDAIGAGSWNATLWYAREMDARGHHDMADETLEEGVEADHVPSFFWLAWLRYKRKRTRQQARAILPLVEYAIEHDHPGGPWLKSRLMATGKLGLHRIPEGFRMAHRQSKWFDGVEAKSRTNAADS